jgi:hypothetical protein
MISIVGTIDCWNDSTRVTFSKFGVVVLDSSLYFNYMPRRINKQKYNAAQVPTPSPPTQLPTPLPEEERVSSTSMVDDDRLIDFDTPTPPPQQPIHLDLEDIDHDEEDGVLTHTYRSPPFREVHLSDLEDPPLPVPPRAYHHQEETLDDYGADSVTAGHTRWPTYSR